MLLGIANSLSAAEGKELGIMAINSPDDREVCIGRPWSDSQIGGGTKARSFTALAGQRRFRALQAWIIFCEFGHSTGTCGDEFANCQPLGHPAHGEF
jgi:hypothetical protein